MIVGASGAIMGGLDGSIRDILRNSLLSRSVSVGMSLRLDIGIGGPRGVGLCDFWCFICRFMVLGAGLGGVGGIRV